VLLLYDNLLLLNFITLFVLGFQLFLFLLLHLDKHLSLKLLFCRHLNYEVWVIVAFEFFSSSLYLIDVLVHFTSETVKFNYFSVLLLTDETNALEMVPLRTYLTLDHKLAYSVFLFTQTIYFVRIYG
jgi:hypothetical protein